MLPMLLAWQHQRTAQAERTDSGFTGTDQEGTASSFENATKQEGQTSRGLDMSQARIANMSLADDYPLLYDACKGDTELLRDLESYAKEVLTQDLAGDVEILGLLEKRDSSLIPYLTPLFENMETAKLDDNWGAYQKELNKLGMTMTAAKGKFISIGVGSFLEEKIANVASPELQALIKFRNAQTESLNGEYPFQNMRPFRDMVIFGEKVLAGKNEAYKSQIDADFQSALEAFTDVHYVSSPDSRQVGVVLVGGTNTDLYPSLGELETAKEFVASEEESKYKKALSRILENPSEISAKPENIYVVVIEWAESKNMAQMRVRSHLGKGEDVPHYLKIRRGDGTDKYAVSYRFYENEEKANNAYDEAIKEFPDARLVFCSVKNGNLYQLGI